MNNVLCRLCLMKCEELFGMYITSPSGVLRCLPKVIRDCISIDVTDVEPNFFSKFICNECIYKLDLFHAFREQSLKSQEYYNGLLLYYQQSVPCTSKTTTEPTAVSVDSVFAIETDPQTQLEQSAHASNELSDINFSGNEFLMDESEKHQLSKDYDDIIRSLQKDDLDFTTNDEELVIKHELEISIPRAGEKLVKEVPVQQGCQEQFLPAQHADEPLPQVTESVNDCYNPYDTLSISSDRDIPISGSVHPTEQDDDLSYDDFVGIHAATLDDGRETPLSETQIHGVIEDEYAVTTQKLQETEELLPTPPRLDDQNCLLASANETFFPLIPYEGPPEVVACSSTVTYTTEHPKVPVNDKTCEICYKTFRTRQKLTIHRNTHLRLAPFKCTFESCSKAFKSRIGFEEHLARHTNSFEYTCDICSKGFQHRSYLSAHRRAHNTERTFQCAQCGMSFKSKQALLDHSNHHLGVKPFACDHCEKQYTKNALLQAHIRQHHSERNEVTTRYPCDECGKCFTSKSYLNVHMRIHRNERPFVCEVCNKGHVTRNDLKVHMTSHTGEKSLICDICGKGYARRSALDWHHRTHTKERPYVCDICGQTFTQSTPLQVHRRLHDVEDQKKSVPKEEILPHSVEGQDHNR